MFFVSCLALSGSCLQRLARVPVDYFLCGRSADGFVFTPFRHSIKNSRRHYTCVMCYLTNRPVHWPCINAICLGNRPTHKICSPNYRKNIESKSIFSHYRHECIYLNFLVTVRVSRYKTTCPLKGSILYFRGFSRIECLLLLNSRGLDLWKSFLQDFASRSRILFSGKMGGLDSNQYLLHIVTSGFQCSANLATSPIIHPNHRPPVNRQRNCKRKHICTRPHTRWHAGMVFSDVCGTCYLMHPFHKHFLSRHICSNSSYQRYAMTYETNFNLRKKDESLVQSDYNSNDPTHNCGCRIFLLCPYYRINSNSKENHHQNYIKCNQNSF